MNTIRSKIIRLMLGVWTAMAAIWLALSFYNQHTVETYNTILQRYLFMNQVSELSVNSVTMLNRFMNDRRPSQQSLYEQVRDQLKQASGRLDTLADPSNAVELENYRHMIESQIEAMELTAMNVKADNRDGAQEHFSEAGSISKYISEMTLTLLSTELRTYNRLYQSMIERSRDLQRMGFWTLAMASCILLLFSYRFAGSIAKPILKLSLAARKISLGHYEEPIEIETNDEISFLAKTFNQMRLSVQHAISEIQLSAQLENDLQEHKLRLKEIELKSLQSQINPHFLFNTLNILAKKAYLEGADETSDLISSVSGLLRYNLKRLDRPVTLGDEVNILEEYMAIQKARFMNRVQYDKQIDESCLSVLVPNLTLQPFVENAFIHAIEPSLRGGRITVRIYRRKPDIIVEIADDGVGMDEARIRTILGEADTMVKAGHSTGIGIGNVIHRLELFYERPDIVRMASSPGEGTCVTLSLPAEEGRAYDSNTDR